MPRTALAYLRLLVHVCGVRRTVKVAHHERSTENEIERPGDGGNNKANSKWRKKLYIEGAFSFSLRSERWSDFVAVAEMNARREVCKEDERGENEKMMTRGIQKYVRVLYEVHILMMHKREDRMCVTTRPGA